MCIRDRVLVAYFGFVTIAESSVSRTFWVLVAYFGFVTIAQPSVNRMFLVLAAYFGFVTRAEPSQKTERSVLRLCRKG